MHRYPLFVSSIVITFALILAACFPIGPGSMGPGGMMRGHDGMMGPGMMRGHDGMMGRGMQRPEPVEGMGRQSIPPPAITPAPTATPGGVATVRYWRDIQPIFSRNCVGCHGGSAGLYLDSYDHVMAGSARGRVVVPGDPQASELVRRLRGMSQPGMPLGRPPLPATDIDTIITWIAEGAPNN